jgi:hypothetical protein
VQILKHGKKKWRIFFGMPREFYTSFDNAGEIALR